MQQNTIASCCFFFLLLILQENICLLRQILQLHSKGANLIKITLTVLTELFFKFIIDFQEVLKLYNCKTKVS